jgi:MEMO1 family protein
MTHYETEQSAQDKDRQAIEAILGLDAAELMRRVVELPISMCGYAPVAAMIAAVRELGAGKPQLVRYQTSAVVSGDYQEVVGYAGIIVPRKKGAAAPPPEEAAAHSSEPPLVKLARETVEAYVRGQRLPRPEPLSEEMRGRAGVFVSLHTRAGRLRGCIGTFQPAQADIAGEVISNAVSAATRDPRFPPVTTGELSDIEYNVDVLTPPEPVDGPDQLDPVKYGVIVEAGYRRGLLLPDLEGVDTVAEQLDICRMKAGIGPGEPVKLYRFQVKRYK